MPMASVMAIESEVFGSYFEEIDVSVELENRGNWLYCGWNYLRLFRASKAAQYLRWRRVMVPGIGVDFWCFGSYRRNKKTLWLQGLLWVGLQ